MIRPEDNIQFALEKVAEKEDTRTFPISRFLTSPEAHGAGYGAPLGAVGALSGVALAGTAGFAARLPRPLALGAAALGGLAGGAAGGAFGGSIGYGGGAILRAIGARNVIGRARRGEEGFGDSEATVLDAIRNREARLGEKDKRTFPISRAVSDPILMGSLGALHGGGLSLVDHGLPRDLRGLGALSRKVLGRAGLAGGGALALRAILARASRGRAQKDSKGIGASDRAVLEALRARQAMSKKSSDNVHVAIEKLAAKKLRVGEIEDRLGFYLDDPQEQQVRDMLGAQVKKRFALRHPWLTGIPTLGIAPAVSAGNAYSSVFRRLMRSQPDLRTRHRAWKVEERMRERQDFKDETKRLAATQQERAAAEHGRTAGALATAALAAQSAHNERESA
jgi:hypothetical protein